MTIAACLLTLVGDEVCAQETRTALQISPEGGGHCIDVPDRQFVQDKRLQMADCDGSPGQTFAYDQAGARLMTGGLCIDADGGQPGDLVKLSACQGGPAQTWQAEQRGNFTKFVGLNGLCLDIRYGSTEKGALVQSWNCADAAPNQLWRVEKK
jgi:hypothetical protein